MASYPAFQPYHGRITMYFNQAGMSMLVYDHLLTFIDEVLLIWPGRWTSVKVLFLLSRYLPFVDIVFRICLGMMPKETSSYCVITYKLNALFYCIQTALPEIMLSIRTWAVWNRDWRVTIGLPVFFVLCWGPVIAFFHAFGNSLNFATGADGSTGCIATQGTNLVFFACMLMLVYRTGTFLLTLSRGIWCYRRGGSSMVFHVVFRDGLLYYSYQLVFAIANVIILAAAPPDLAIALIVVERFIHPILACRAVLDIRRNADILRAPLQHHQVLSSVTLGPRTDEEDPFSDSK